MIIAIPTGVKVFNWIFTMYKGRIRFSAPMWWFMAFASTFLIGGATGVMLAVPAIDFQVHNSMFLVAHFHNTIIGGVVFGFIAGITYWWPKMFGFTLHDGLGKLSALFWQIGFLLTFMPLYALGFMGAVRRIDHYTNPEWLPFFIVSAIGVVVIGIGIALLVLQIGFSILKRKQLRDTTGDPWNGRTLEWSVPSPAPFYNFAVTPRVKVVDDWWWQKQHDTPPSISYKDIELPKNSGAGLYIGVAAGVVSFGLIWHMWWLAALAMVAVIGVVIVRTMNDDSEYVVTAKELAKLDKKTRRWA